MHSRYRDIILAQIKEVKEELNKESSDEFTAVKLSDIDINKIGSLRSRLEILTLELSDLKH